MTHIKFTQTLFVFFVALILTSCGNSSSVYEQPVIDDGRELENPETPIAKTLFQKVLEKGVPEIPLRQAFDYFEKNKAQIKNQNYITIIDFTQHSVQKRFYLIDMKTGAVDKILTAHGKGSDSNHDGVATVFSNVSGSNATSLGFMLTAERYIGSHGISLRLDGLENINSNVRSRAIVIHGADYVDPNRPVMGRSLGCPAVENRLIVSLVKKIENGSLVYSYYKGL